MMTVKEVSRLTGVSVRTLQYYDRIGLLHPAGYTESGYRLYDDAALETLQQILLFREPDFYTFRDKNRCISHNNGICRGLLLLCSISLILSLKRSV